MSQSLCHRCFDFEFPKALAKLIVVSLQCLELVHQSDSFTRPQGHTSAKIRSETILSLNVEFQHIGCYKNQHKHLHKIRLDVRKPLPGFVMKPLVSQITNMQSVG